MLDANCRILNIAYEMKYEIFSFWILWLKFPLVAKAKKIFLLQTKEPLIYAYHFIEYMVHRHGLLVGEGGGQGGMANTRLALRNDLIHRIWTCLFPCKLT